MPAKIAIIAALPREIAGLVRGHKPDEVLRKQGVYLYRLPNALVTVGGMGGDRAALAVEAALSTDDVDTLISAGLAGGCVPLLKGKVFDASVVVDVKSGEKFDTDFNDVEEHHVVLATTASIADVQEKARLAEAYGAAMVDMEAATVARLAHAHGLKFRAIKGISDPHDFELPSLARFTGSRGEFRTAAFTFHTALRPGHWPKAVQLGRNSALALNALHKQLSKVMRNAD